MLQSALVYILREQSEPSSPDQIKISELTSKYHYVVELSIEQAKELDLSRAIMLIIDVQLDNFQTVTALKEILKQPDTKSVPSLYILDAINRRQTVQVQALGGTDFLIQPIITETFVSKLEELANNSIENSWSDLTKIQEAALRVSLKVIEDMFDNVGTGQSITNNEVRTCCDLTIQATKDEGLGSRISAIRTHHNYTYRHSMTVCGYLAAFGLLIGVSGIELQNLVSAGLIHDIGKAKIPNHLLNKPSPLTEHELKIMRKHPEYSREILEPLDLHQNIKDGCIQHHEKLDGSGYPDGLKGEEISDIARMIAIADVFSGLTEKRAYRDSVSNQSAYDIMLTMDGHLDMGGIFSIFGIIFLLGSWHVPDIFEIQQLLGDADRRAFIWSPIAPPGLQTFSIASLSLVGISSLAIFIRLPWLPRRALWATLGNLLPLTVLIIAYWRIKDLDTSIPFAGIAVIIALILTYGTKYIGDKSEGEAKAPIAAYAAGATMAIALALTMVLREAWLSFALALELVALGYIWQKTAVHGLRQLAVLLASVILVRLFLNASIFDYHPGSMPIINWLFYGYGLTSGLFYLASKIFSNGTENDRLVTILRAGWIIILISFISLELRVLFSEGGRLYSAPSELEVALQTITWSLATVILMWREIKDQDKLLGHLRRFMTVVSLAGLILGGGLANNIFFSGVDVGPLIIINLQFLQFLVPALLYAAKAYMARMASKPKSLKVYSMVAFLAFWFWLSAEVRHAFHPNGSFGSPSDWEGYTYSLVWPIYSVILLVIGLQRKNETIRLAGLGVLSVVVLKVFISDMSELEGLARALSFMGLGAALIGIGYLYQRLKVIEAKTDET